VGCIALRRRGELKVVPHPLAVYGVYALRVIATLEVVSQQMIIIQCETTSTEHERKAYTPKTTFIEPKREAIHPPKH
jgi:hypothetical protein